MIPQPAIDLILSDEGLDQPGKWPGGESGITIGHGFDLGYADKEKFVKDWSGHLDAGALGRLLAVVGFTGRHAQAWAVRLSDIHITEEQADAVFLETTIAEEEATTAEAFPGVELLPDLARGALVSLVYNRGPGMAESPADPEHDRRREMRGIRDAIAAWAAQDDQTRSATLGGVLEAIAGLIRSMKRLWQGKGLNGLLTRREQEAKLVESAIPVEPAQAA